MDATEYAIRSYYDDLDGEIVDHRIEVTSLQRSYYEKYYVSNRSKLDYIDEERRSNIIEELSFNEPDRNSYYSGKKSD